MNVLVASGGISSERDISLLSGKAVMAAGQSAGHNMTFYDWDGNSDWLLKHASEFDVILPIQHGKGSEDGQIQKILEQTKVPFLGSDSEVSATCFDKQKTLAIYKANNILTPEGELVDIDAYRSHKLTSKPHILKPNDDGSSVGVILVKDPQTTNRAAIETEFQKRHQLLLEELVDGIEITTPVLDKKTLPIIKIVPPINSMFDYENKYNGQTQEIVSPTDISHDIQTEAQQLGVKIHKLLGCRHLSRSDMMLKDNKLYVLETNTMPGLTMQSLFPKAAAAIGMDFPALVDYFIKLTLGEV